MTNDTIKRHLNYIRKLAMIRRLLCIFRFHEPIKQIDPFGFGDEIVGCRYCDVINIKLCVKINK